MQNQIIIIIIIRILIRIRILILQNLAEALQSKVKKNQNHSYIFYVLIHLFFLFNVLSLSTALGGFVFILKFLFKTQVLGEI